MGKNSIFNYISRLFAVMLLVLGGALPANARVTLSKSIDARQVKQDGAGELPPPTLESLLVDVRKCAAEAGGATLRCAELHGFTLVETRSDLSDFRFVVAAEQAFQTFLEPAGCDRAQHAPVAEFRLFEGRPFAVIQRTDCLPPVERIASKAGARKLLPERSYFVVRGLPGFETLQSEIPVDQPGKRGLASSELRARRRADEYLLSLWPGLAPALLAERASAALADADATGDEDDASAAEEASAASDQHAAPDEIVVVIDVR